MAARVVISGSRPKGSLGSQRDAQRRKAVGADLEEHEPPGPRCRPSGASEVGKRPERVLRAPAALDSRKTTVISRKNKQMDPAPEARCSGSAGPALGKISTSRGASTSARTPGCCRRQTWAEAQERQPAHGQRVMKNCGPRAPAPARPDDDRKNSGLRDSRRTVEENDVKRH